ncbi:hypothetical protein CEXT_524351 [Caerostris extrusa]|uniref:Uncharacterized protein n=1 Tax=Caerostris extrusa TaxID=172846 RepID=A0AAV4XMC0_CAEEX|nr:hypothetical protein CEXT_524351 [Caerostris extrusa]
MSLITGKPCFWKECESAVTVKPTPLAKDSFGSKRRQECGEKNQLWVDFRDFSTASPGTEPVGSNSHGSNFNLWWNIA